ncbi:MAG: hypothetical protein F6K47_43220, partial [Symploca sp. SIO2E6]|nr:hypothetical protein [Symploca sp. SIO2E6]
MVKELDKNNLYSPNGDIKLPHIHNGLRANQSTSIGRKHVESEESLNSVIDFPKIPFQVENFVTGKHGISQILSADEATGESTQRVFLQKGWSAPIGHFTTDIELFV